jgi:Protein of unknown function (DUF1570)
MPLASAIALALSRATTSVEQRVPVPTEPPPAFPLVDLTPPSSESEPRSVHFKAVFQAALAALLAVSALAFGLAAFQPNGETRKETRFASRVSPPPPRPTAPYGSSNSSSQVPPAPTPQSFDIAPPPPEPSASSDLPIRSEPPPPTEDVAVVDSASTPSSTVPVPSSLVDVPAPPVPNVGGESPPPPPALEVSTGSEDTAPSAANSDEPKRVLVRDDSGKPVICKVYGEIDGRNVVMLPDGQLGWINGKSNTSKPFHPATADEMRDALLEGPYRDFKVRQTEHYLILFRCTETFAADSAHLLETLYQGLLEKLADWGLDVHEAEFPLVAVIYDTERAFRTHNRVAPEVQAFYHIHSNRIFFFEKSEKERANPEVAMIRQPQTIAHEGTHQILLNIGVQRRLAKWPIWLVEGLAEYWAPTITKKGAEWAGGGRVNALHMATIHDLKDQAELQRRYGGPGRRVPRPPLVEELAKKTELTPTDYATAWALTHYLATKPFKEFIAYVKEMGEMSPTERPTPDDQLKAFRNAFGSDLTKVDKAVAKHLAALKYDPLPYYAVLFAQTVGGGLHKAALVSQSPSMILQWIAESEEPRGGQVTWEAVPCSSKTRALVTADQWLAAH